MQRKIGSELCYKTQPDPYIDAPENKGPFPLRAWKRAFFVSFIDLRLKRAQKKLIKQTKNALFYARSGNGSKGANSIFEKI